MIAKFRAALLRTSFLFALAIGIAFSSFAQDDPRFLIIVLDGLRPDYVTPELMPTLHAFGEGGVVFENHHAVYPTVTRVNSASISTGSYPARHGLMGNSVYFPEVDPDKSLNTSDWKNLTKIDEATGGNLLTAESLGEILERNGKTLLAVSSGSTGSAMLLNHKARGGGVINHGLVLPETNRDHVFEVLGDPPEDGTPNDGRNGWAVDAYIEIGLDETKPDVTFMWLSDPDHTAHEYGIGAPETVEALKLVDAQFGRILDAHRARGLEDTTNIMVTSDHGFSTHVGGEDLSGLLEREGFSDEVVVAGGAIHFRIRDVPRMAALGELLHREEWVGATFTRGARPNLRLGIVPYTLTFHEINWDHERAADILVSANWSSERNAHGYEGQTTQGGVAGHGSTSPFDIHATLIVGGPSFRNGVRIEAESSCNVDLAPTVCYVLKVAASGMDGRPLLEALKGEKPARTERHSFTTPKGLSWYRQVIWKAVVRDKTGSHVYFQGTEVYRGEVERRPDLPR